MQSTAAGSAALQAATPYRAALVGVESFVAIAGLGGTAQLIAGIFTPPVDDLPPGLASWALPGVWLFGTVALPAAVAAWLAFRRSPYAPTAVLVAACTLALEVVVQIPFIGPSWLQVVFGGLAVALAVLAVRARSRGWRPPRPRDAGDGPVGRGPT
ncbi:MAG TPA: hypothetical protein VFU98_07950 [Microlunatus sp.]|jgi:hypothetical protein|nr:hypothetical protein [Microlunatus sp.]